MRPFLLHNNANSESLPIWTQLMYAENPDEGEVITSYKLLILVINQKVFIL